MDLLNKYIEELKNDTKIDDLNIKEVQMRLPSRKHYWVARLVDAKIQLDRLKSQEKQLRADIEFKIRKDSPVTITSQSLTSMINNTDEIKTIHSNIKQYEYIIEYLEKVEKVMSQMSYDIANIVRIMQLEQQ